MSERKTTCYKLLPEVKRTVDQLADENNTTKSNIVETAVREYADQDRVARLEAKVDLLLEGEGVPSERTETKKKKSSVIRPSVISEENFSEDDSEVATSGEGSSSDSGSESDTDSDFTRTREPTESPETDSAMTDGGEDQSDEDAAEGDNDGDGEGNDDEEESRNRIRDVVSVPEHKRIGDLEEEYGSRSDDFLKHGPLDLPDKLTRGYRNRMVNQLVLQNDKSTLLPEEEIRDAIVDMKGNSDHFHKQYYPDIVSKLEDLGFCKSPFKELWFCDEQTARIAVKEYWKTVKNGLEADEMDERDLEIFIDDLNKIVENIEAVRDALVKYNVEDEDVVNEVLREAVKRHRIETNGSRSSQQTFA